MPSEVTIVGAGPYGLSLAAHLEDKHIAFRIFGDSMAFWQRSMPAGMQLKSDGHASSLFDPQDTFSLATYCAEVGAPYEDLGLPVPIETFIAYGHAFQRRYVPHVENEAVTSIRKESGEFTVELASGHTFSTRAVVLAVGVGYFAYLPPVFDGLGESIVTHSSQHSDLSEFRGRGVAVVGAGASALDIAALLHDAGARPVLVTRRDALEFHQRQRVPRRWLERVLAPTSGIGPGWHSWFYCRAPGLFRHLPERQRRRRSLTHLGPAGGWFIRDAVLENVPVRYDSQVVAATLEDGRVRISLSTSANQLSDLVVDHVIAATGYRVDVDRLGFLDPGLRSKIATVAGSPPLSSTFESSVPGLFFVGASAAATFGPVQRFAVGARFAARRVTRRLAHYARRSR